MNIIAPLPDNVRDPADKSGAVALALGKGKIGEYETSGFYNLRLDDLAVSTPDNPSPPDNVTVPEAAHKDARDGHIAKPILDLLDQAVKAGAQHAAPSAP